MSGTIQGTLGTSISGTITITPTPNIGSTYTTSGAISEVEGIVVLTPDFNVNPFGEHMTLAAPTSGTDDGKILTIVNQPVSGGGGNSDVTTSNDSYGGNSSPWTNFNFNNHKVILVLQAWQGHWFQLAASVS